MSDDIAWANRRRARRGLFAEFLALVATQFFVSLNDNMFRWLVMSIGKELLRHHWARCRR